jgi:small multidrug resistance family-3 protein
LREHKPFAWALVVAFVLAAYGVVAALQPIAEFGRVYAAYGGVSIALALLWGVVVDGSAPTGTTSSGPSFASPACS